MAEIELFLQGEGIAQIVLVKVPEDGSVRDIVEAARAQGYHASGDDSPAVFLEGNEEPLVPGLTLKTAGIQARRRVHVHTCRKVKISINFNAEEKSHPFSPATTMAAVKKWADDKFKLSGVDATEHALQLCGTSNRPGDDIHVGSLVASNTCALCFDLVPKQRVEG
jgi:hypothetical protein